MASTLLGAPWLRFGIVGAGSNALLFLLYLALVELGLPYPAAMTASYACGVAFGFAAHRRWTFDYRGPGATAAVRYLLAYAGGYALNLAGLHLLVERAGIGPAPAQALMIVVVAACLYLAQRHWVFPARRDIR